MIAWKFNVPDPNIASVRYRALIPSAALQQQGITSEFFWGNCEIDYTAFDAIIFVKTFTDHDIYLAEQAVASNVPVIFDLCDNIYTEGYGGKKGDNIVSNFEQLTALASLVITTGPELSKVISDKISTPIMEIVDADEGSARLSAVINNLKNAVEQKQLLEKETPPTSALLNRISNKLNRITHKASGLSKQARNRASTDYLKKRQATQTKRLLRSVNPLKAKIRGNAIKVKNRLTINYIRKTQKRLSAKIKGKTIWLANRAKPAYIRKSTKRINAKLKSKARGSAITIRNRANRQYLLKARKRFLAKVRQTLGIIISLIVKTIRLVAPKNDDAINSPSERALIEDGNCATKAETTAKNINRDIVNIDGPIVEAPKKDVKTLLWFGNHGASYANFGMLDLLEITDVLEDLSSKFDFRLLVVSNNQEKYEDSIKPLNFPSDYLAWHPQSINKLIAGSDAVLIPNSLDAFSACKSANRAILALQLGTPVVATKTSALQVFEDCTILDNWSYGIERYLTDSVFAENHVSEAKKIITKIFSQHSIGSRWQFALNLVSTSKQNSRPAEQTNSAYEIEVNFFLNVIMDLDVLLPVIRGFSTDSKSLVRVWINQSLTQASFRTQHTLSALNINYEIIRQDVLENPLWSGPGKKVPANNCILITATESNLRPHTFSHQLAHYVNGIGGTTYTLQHGFENIGLTYTDEHQPIEKIEFASKHILTWGQVDKLLPDIPLATKKKCTPVGNTKPAMADNQLPEFPHDGNAIIGIIENLHWSRYSDAYRMQFLADLQEAALRSPETTFLIKPHPAGKWFTSRYKGDKPSAKNLIVIDPEDKKYSNFNAPQFFNVMDAVITTPSTVAIDAARAGLPVALVANDQHFDLYEPLPLLKTADDWTQFIQSLSNPADRQKTIDKGNDYINRNIVPGDAIQCIIDLVLKNITQQQSSRAA